ncbi:spore protease YyaC [Oceanobacillus chungangensis]|uniref:Spore protease YyaC n=1 Tax=Oceanobacillus chungangensis TaxID=1229152 RepID=A0A3D8PL11_9BACI|nr:spore protease YyaC [Oceanobacillus chungangensis]RDW16783.1 spore protease YyaC [Oceanobacillus chungangensis]
MNLINRFSNNNQSFRMLHTEPVLSETISGKIISWLPNAAREYVIVCIGTDRSTGDALGPLVGSYFQELRPRHMTVYGTLHDPIHATNLTESILKINEIHTNPFIIAVDACLGKNTSIGHIITGTGPLKPGAALNKPLPEVGDIHITGVVNIGGFMEYSILQNTRLSIVVDMAKQITAILDHIDRRLTSNETIPAIVTMHKHARRNMV